MSTLSYIVLSNSDSSRVKRFRVVYGQYQPKQTKAQDLRRTVTGKLDLTQGAIAESWALGLRVYATDPDGTAYGTLEDLKAFYALTDPGATPSDTLTLTLPTGGAAILVKFVGDLAEEQQTPMLDGASAWFYVPVLLERTT